MIQTLWMDLRDPLVRPQAMELALSLWKDGQLVAFPTETVYGLGADARNAAAVERIFAAKERPADNPLIVHTHTADRAFALAEAVDDRAYKLAALFWPGPLTMVLPRSSAIPAIVSAGLDTVALRVPASPYAQQLLQYCDMPIAAPSANRSMRTSPTCASDVFEDLNGRIALLLDGGPCPIGVESTVLDLTKSAPVILRPGGVTHEMLQEAIGPVALHPSILTPLAKDERAASPGMRYKHYAPRAQVRVVSGPPKAAAQALCRLYDGQLGRRVRILCEEALLPALIPRDAVALYRAQAPELAAERLYALLRRADRDAIDCVLCQAPDAGGIGLAVLNRLYRAAGFDIVHVE